MRGLRESSAKEARYRGQDEIVRELAGRPAVYIFALGGREVSAGSPKANTDASAGGPASEPGVRRKTRDKEAYRRESSVDGGRGGRVNSWETRKSW